MRMPVMIGLVLAAGLHSGAIAADANQVAHGKALFAYWCAPCHGAGAWELGRQLPGTASLQNKYKGAKTPVLEERDDLIPSFTKFVMRNGQEGMPFFRKTELSDADADAIAAYLARNIP